MCWPRSRLLWEGFFHLFLYYILQYEMTWGCFIAPCLFSFHCAVFYCNLPKPQISMVNIAIVQIFQKLGRLYLEPQWELEWSQLKQPLELELLWW